MPGGEKKVKAERIAKKRRKRRLGGVILIYSNGVIK